MSKGDGAPIRVLAVDDEESTIAAVGSILRPQGCTVLAAKSGEEALAVAASARPDIILLDVQMPGMNGNDVASSLSTDERTNSIPIVMLTSFDGHRGQGSVSGRRRGFSHEARGSRGAAGQGRFTGPAEGLQRRDEATSDGAEH